MRAKRGENFCNYFSSLQSTEQTFFQSFHEQTVLFSQEAEHTIYFPLFAKQYFFTQITAPPPPQESNGRPLSVRTDIDQTGEDLGCSGRSYERRLT